MLRHPLAILTLLAFLAFGISLANPLLFDDAAFLTGNRWLAWEFVGNFFRSAIPVSNLSFVGYRPLVMTTFAIEREWFGEAAWILRLTNLLFHAGASFLVFHVARRLLRNDRVALFCAAFFLLHSVQTNVIALAWKRSDLLLGIGVFMTLLFGQRWMEEEKGRWGSWAIALLGALVAFLSKESALMLPIAVLLAHHLLWKVRRAWRFSLAFFYGPLVLVSAVHAWIVFGKIPEAISHLRGMNYMPPSLQMDRLHYLLSQGPAFLEYLSLAFFPAGLRVFHSLPAVSSWHDPRFLLPLLLVLLLVLTAILLRRRNPVVSFGILFFLLWLAPTSVTPLNLPFDEDRLYLPLFGLALIAGSLGQELYDRFRSRKLAALPFVLLSLFVAQDILRLRDWRDPVTLWGANVREEPGDARGWLNLGDALRSRGETDAAERALERSAELEPDYGLPLLHLGMLRIEKGDLAAAEGDLLEAFAKNAFPADVLGQLGVLKARQGSAGDAVRFFSLSLSADPGSGVTLRNYAKFLFEAGHPGPAGRAVAFALQVDPLDPATLALAREISSD